MATTNLFINGVNVGPTLLTNTPTRQDLAAAVAGVSSASDIYAATNNLRDKLGADFRRHRRRRERGHQRWQCHQLHQLHRPC